MIFRSALYENEVWRIVQYGELTPLRHVQELLAVVGWKYLDSGDAMSAQDLQRCCSIPDP